MDSIKLDGLFSEDKMGAVPASSCKIYKMGAVPASSRMVPRVTRPVSIVPGPVTDNTPSTENFGGAEERLN